MAARRVNSSDLLKNMRTAEGVRSNKLYKLEYKRGLTKVPAKELRAATVYNKVTETRL